jgi:alkaline phosphatase D
VLDAVAATKVRHLVVLTGDVHSSWAYDLARNPFEKAGYDPNTGLGAIGTEIVTPSVTSPGGPPPDRVPALHAARPHLKYVTGEYHGYVILDLSRERLQADWWAVPTITERSASERFAKGMVSGAVLPRLEDASRPSAAVAAPDPAPDLL